MVYNGADVKMYTKNEIIVGLTETENNQLNNAHVVFVITANRHCQPDTTQ